MSQINNKMILCLILIFSIFAILAAYFIQYVLDHQPCNLCLIERVPYIFVIVIISLCLFYKKYEKISMITISLIFFSATIISSYHFGIEKGFIKESLVCNLVDENKLLTKEAILNQLTNKVISCKNVTFKIFGLSLATINVAISLILSLITIKLFLNYEKNK